ncbi:uncharacterized protein LOC125551539 [Triticum urartu]|uniref:uncharacterized protein LOC125551539 n=1 Tax=Triticum urartu TaxID=4572 RepID=UPI002044BCE3|nr:uncharacterized protein LOC125551539 [Triticum urartu]
MPTFARASFPVIVRPDGTRQNLSLVRIRLTELVSSTKKQHKACQFTQSISVFQFPELASSPTESAAPRRFTAAALVRSSLPIEVVRQCSVEVGQRRNVAMDAPNEGQRKAKNKLVQLLASSSYPILENILRPLCFLK